MTEEIIKEEVLAEVAKLQQLEEEVKEWKDKYLLLLAEKENMHKRLVKERQETSRFAIESAMAEMLHPLDSLENALAFTEHMSKETQQWAAGFQMILAQFKDALLSQGIHAFESEGTLFDPHKHQAVEVDETSDKPEGTVVKEFIKGYRCGERIVRPARVKVAKKQSNNKEEGELKV